MSYYRQHLFLCVNQKAAGKTCCANQGGELFFDYLKKKLLALNLYGPGKIRISKSGCLGRCSEGPVLVIYPEGLWYRYESEADLDEIIEQQILLGKKVARLCINSDAFA